MKAPLLIHDLLKPKVLYVSDLDGTLLTPSSLVSDESARLLNEAIYGGAHFTIATARTPATVIDLLKNVDMRLPGVVMTGSALFNFSNHQFSRLQFMAPGVASALLALYRKHNVGTFVYTFDNDMLIVYHSGNLNDYEREFITERSHTGVKKFLVSDDGKSRIPENLDNTLLFYSVQPWEPAYTLFKDIKASGLQVTPLCYHDHLGEEWGELEMFAHTANKAAAVEDIASHIGAGRIVAFGDNINDLPLFRLADEGIAVANAVPELKALASDIIDDNSSPSVATFIHRHTLG